MVLTDSTCYGHLKTLRELEWELAFFAEFLTVEKRHPQNSGGQSCARGIEVAHNYPGTLLSLPSHSMLYSSWGQIE